MKHRILFLLALMLTATSWLAAQHAVWWGGSPPPDGTTRDHSVSYGNGFAWQVVLGTARSSDTARDAIALSSGGYLVMGTNAYFEGNTVTHNNLVLYRLSEGGDLLWEKEYTITIEDNQNLLQFSLIEKPDGGFLMAGIMAYAYETNPRSCILINSDANGDTLSTITWSSPTMSLNDIKLIKSDFDESFYVSYRLSLNSQYKTEIFKLNYNLDTLAFTEIPEFFNPEHVPKPFGYMYKGKHFDSIFYHYLISLEGEVLDSFPDPFGDLANGMYPMQSLQNGNNVFFRTELSNPKIFKMATTTDAGEVLHINPRCFSGDDVWGFDQPWIFTPCEFSDGSILVPFNWYFDYFDNYSIGLVKISSLGQHLGDTAINRAAGSMMLVKVLEGGDGRPVIFGTGENGPFGGPFTGKDIFIAKLEAWNPTGVTTPSAADTMPLMVYPNPANDAVVVTLPTGAKGTLTVQTLLGSVIHSQPVAGNGELTLSTANWPAGPLIVSLTTPNGVLTTKLVKN
ncbi:MAG: T9SS type A sorting domain-containing protein [Bacteroidales bacterium]|nr:T9SS type A sorting domain-containing protein [Bacteroidales bacterium]